MRCLSVPGAVFFALVVGFAARVTPAEAAKIRNPIKVAAWSGGAYFDDQTKAFERCSATNSSAAGISVSYSVDRDYRWSVALTNPAWNFVKGATQNVSLKIGDGNVMGATAVALDKGTLDLRTSDPILFWARLRIAHQLRIVMGGLLLEFTLEGGEEALSALTQCALRSTRYSQTAKPADEIFAAEETARPAHVKEAAALVGKIIEFARVADWRALPTADDIAILPADAAWKAGLVVGGVTIVETTLPNQRVADAIVARAFKDCHGGFFFDSQPDEINKSPIVRVFVSCQTTETTTSSHNLIIPRPQAGYYVVTVVSTGSSFIGIAHKTADEDEARLRSVIMLAIQSN